MGRIKRGLDYFPMSTDFMHNRMVRRIMKREGDASFAVIVEVLSYIYSGEGYYIVADQEFYDELTDGLYELQFDGVKRILALAVEYGLFDATLYHEHNILTSADIQRQYLFIARRRSCLLIQPEYCLLQPEELASYKGTKSGAETSPSSDNQKTSKAASKNAVAESTDAVAENTDAVTESADAATFESEKTTLSTQIKRKENKEKQNKTNNLPNPPQGGDEGGGVYRNNLIKKGKITPDGIAAMQAPSDGTPRNLPGLVENLQFYKISPAEQHAIILKSNFGAIGNPVWKGINVVRSSNGKIKLPGHYLLSVLNG